MKDQVLNGLPRAGALFTAEGENLIHGKPLKWRSEGQDYVFFNEKGEAEASIFLTSFFADEAQEKRPIIFFFPGGPGANGSDSIATVYGPFIDRENEDGYFDNENSLLDIADLVAVDPVGCGYAKLQKEDAKSKYYGGKEDALAMTQAIYVWMKQHRREVSPVFIAGRSYGGARVSLVLPNMEAVGIIPSGIASVVGIEATDFANKGSTPDGDPAGIIILPSLAAANQWHHPEDKPDWQEFTDQACEFADTEYRAYLDAKAADPKTIIAPETLEKLKFYTGLSKAFLAKTDFTLSDMDFISLQLNGKSMCFLTDVREIYAVLEDPNVDLIIKGASTIKKETRYSAKPEGQAEYEKRLGMNFIPPRERHLPSAEESMNRGWKWALAEDLPVKVLDRWMERHPECFVFIGKGIYDFNVLPGTGRWEKKHFGDRIVFKEYPCTHYIAGGFLPQFRELIEKKLNK